MNQEFNGNVKVNGNDIALKGSTLVASGTFDSDGKILVQASLLSDGMYMLTYNNAQCFVYITSDMLASSGTAPILAPCSCVYQLDGSFRPGTLRISNTSEGIAFKVIDGQGNTVAAYGVYLFKTNLG